MAAAKTKGTRNPERRTGKAWAKDHGVEVKKNPNAEEEYKARRARRAQENGARLERGYSLTMPRITWEWCTQILSSRWPNTRKSAMVYMCIERKIGDNAAPLEIEPNPEAKAISRSRKNGR